MSIFRPFRGLRPKPELAQQVASHPYDVLSRQEAVTIASGNPLSFLHINMPEVDLEESVAAYDSKIYEKGAENLRKFIQSSVLSQDSDSSFYIYKQQMGDHAQIGVVGVASVEAYENGLIKKHELTRPQKETDRVEHMVALRAQVGPVFLTYHASNKVDEIVAAITERSPEYDFVSDDDTRHVFWLVDAAQNALLEQAFNEIECLYVADGHHRSAAASRVKTRFENENDNHTGKEAYNYFLSVVFPHNQMQILDYNRLLKDLNGISREQFIKQIEALGTVKAVMSYVQAKPQNAGEFAIYLPGQWYSLKLFAEQTLSSDDVVSRESSELIESLDVSRLQDLILKPMLGVEDQRTDSRIDFVGGIRGLQELQKRVDSGQWAIAFALYPTSVESLMAVADAGKVMPPKSTWFEPKLRSGLVVHLLE